MDTTWDAGAPNQPGGIADRINHLFETRLSPRGRRYTLREVSEATAGKITIPWLSAVRKGRFSMPAGDKLQALADFFGVDVGYFLGTTPPPSRRIERDEDDSPGLDDEEELSERDRKLLDHAMTRSAVRNFVFRSRALDSEGLCRIALAEAHAHMQHGRTAWARRAAVQAEELAVIVGQDLLAAEALRLQAWALGCSGESKEALARAQAAMSLAHERSAPRAVVQGQLCIAELGARMATFAQSREVYQAALTAARQHRWSEEQAASSLGLGATLLELGRLELAEAAVLQALVVAEDLADPALRARAHYTLARLWTARALLYEDDAVDARRMAAREALHYYDVALAGARHEGLEPLTLTTALDMAVALTEFEGAVSQQVRDLRELATETLVPMEYPLVSRLYLVMSRSELALAEGEYALGTTDITGMLTEIAQVTPSLAARAYRIAGRAAHRKNEPDGRDAYFDTSLSLAARHGQALEEQFTHRARRLLTSASSDLAPSAS